LPLKTGVFNGKNLTVGSPDIEDLHDLLRIMEIDHLELLPFNTLGITAGKAVDQLFNIPCRSVRITRNLNL